MGNLRRVPLLILCILLTACNYTDSISVKTAVFQNRVISGDNTLHSPTSDFYIDGEVLRIKHSKSLGFNGNPGTTYCISYSKNNTMLLWGDGPCYSTKEAVGYDEETED